MGRLKDASHIAACKQIMHQLSRKRYRELTWIFYDQVDANLLLLRDYDAIVKYPMNLSTIWYKLRNDLYDNAIEFAGDMRLMFYNTYLYTNPDHICYQLAKRLQLIFEYMFKKSITDKAQFSRNIPK